LLQKWKIDPSSTLRFIAKLKLILLPNANYRMTTQPKIILHTINKSIQLTQDNLIKSQNSNYMFHRFDHHLRYHIVSRPDLHLKRIVHKTHENFQ